MGPRYTLIWGAVALVAAAIACGAADDEASIVAPQPITASPGAPAGTDPSAGAFPSGPGADASVQPLTSSSEDAGADGGRALPDNCHAPLPSDSDVFFDCNDSESGWSCNLWQRTDAGLPSAWSFYFGCSSSTTWAPFCSCTAEGPKEIPLPSSARLTDAEMLSIWRANCTSVCLDPPPYVPPPPPSLDPDAGALIVNAYTPAACLGPLPSDEDVRVDLSVGTDLQWVAVVYPANEPAPGAGLFDCGFSGQLACSYNFPWSRIFGPPAGITPTRESILAVWRAYWTAACNDYATNPPFCVVHPDAPTCQGHGL